MYFQIYFYKGNKLRDRHNHIMSQLNPRFMKISKQATFSCVFHLKVKNSYNLGLIFTGTNVQPRFAAISRNAKRQIPYPPLDKGKCVHTLSKPQPGTIYSVYICIQIMFSHCVCFSIQIPLIQLGDTLIRIRAIVLGSI